MGNVLRKGLLSDQRGFTLLEMLIVISIAGVLAAVAVPRFTNAIALANTSRVQSDLQVLNSAIVLYQAEKGEYPSDLNALEPYVLDIQNVKPPKGKCQLRNGDVEEITAASYGLSDDRSEATCQSHKLSAFGRKE
ncbi:MAG: type II secretion system protein [Schwartzia sp.]|nr:type II secretion system protein [Schwartzia sp. (in: firmicutes)]MBR5162981.1 type II secretion system protein [Schwartzia sp. (in: firmicutes)]